MALAGNQSYWLDELLSVQDYVLVHETVGNAIASLAETSVHPPLYQFILYFWIDWVGDSEVITRTLSNVYITAAIVTLHAFVRRSVGLAHANAAAIAFSLSYAATHFGLETRSYAQTLLLASLSSLVFYLYLQNLVNDSDRRSQHTNTISAILIAANTALLLTHYYNFFYWAAQASFAILFILLAPTHIRRRALTNVTILYTLQATIFGLIWGRVAYNTFTTRYNEGRFAVDEPTVDPLQMVGRITEANIPFSRIGVYVVLLGMFLMAAAWIYSRIRQSDTGFRTPGVTGAAYSLWMAIFPPVLAYLAFVFLGAERFLPRYLVFIVPHLITVAIIAGSQLLQYGRESSLSHTLLSQVRRSYISTLGLGLLFLLFVPGTLLASLEEKDDWRGNAELVVRLVEENPEQEFAIISSSSSPTRLDYYLKRLSDNRITTDAVVGRRQEVDNDFSIGEDIDNLEELDRIIMTFSHSNDRAPQYANALAWLDDEYQRDYALLNESGQGLVLYRKP